MGFKIYKLKVSSKNFIKNYEVYAKDLEDASKQAKVKFAKDFNEIGSNVKISLQQQDINNHIEEICLYVGSMK